jgi:L-asparagine transporter-like permease
MKIEFNSPILFFLFLTLLVLKLGFGIDMSWWWVTAPIWVPFLILGILGLVVALIDRYDNFKQRNK